MSGGSWEYVMGNYNRYSGYSSKRYTIEEAKALGRDDGAPVGLWNSGYSGMCGLDKLTFIGKNWLADKYYNFYETNDTNTACDRKKCISHALSETSGWYDGNMTMVGPQWSWLMRGGYWRWPTNNFVVTSESGNFIGDNSFRLVLSAS